MIDISILCKHCPTVGPWVAINLPTVTHTATHTATATATATHIALNTAVHTVQYKAPTSVTHKHKHRQLHSVLHTITMTLKVIVTLTAQRHWRQHVIISVVKITLVPQVTPRVRVCPTTRPSLLSLLISLIHPLIPLHIWPLYQLLHHYSFQ